ncbi:MULTISPECIES: hypothetical protein [Bacillus cereus group]|nr:MULTISPECIES: hypothetical protein [Bacillus cereus group]MDA2124486.1 hypothetical protein [Bacillus cereus]
MLVKWAIGGFLLGGFVGSSGGAGGIFVGGVLGAWAATSFRKWIARTFWT